jgi:hypothetical protein
MSRLGNLLGVFFLIVILLLAGTAAAGLLAGGGNGTFDGRSIDGQSPSQFQPSRVDPGSDPETGAIEPPDRPGSKRILVDTSHGNEFERQTLEPLAAALFEGGHSLVVRDEADDLGSGGSVGDDTGYRQTLERYDGVLIVQPTTGFTPNETRAIEAYTDAGGRVVVLGEPTQTQVTLGLVATTTVNRFGANNLTAEYGAVMGPERLYNLDDDDNDNNYMSIYAEPSSTGALTEGVDRISFDDSGFAVLETGTDADVVYEAVEGTRTLDTRREGTYPTVVRNGNMVFVADTSFIKRSEIRDVDNEVFVGNLLDFLAGGDRPTLTTDGGDGSTAQTPAAPNGSTPPA